MCDFCVCGYRIYRVWCTFIVERDESMDVFVTRLRTLSKTCDFGEQLDEAIRDQAIDKCVSKELRRRLLREPDIDLAKLLTISRAFEQSDFQAQEMEQPTAQLSDSIYAIRPGSYNGKVSSSRREIIILQHILKQNMSLISLWDGVLNRVIVVARQVTLQKMFDALQTVKHVGVVGKLVILPMYAGVVQSQLIILHQIKTKLSR